MILPSFDRMPSTLRTDKERGYNEIHKAFLMAAVFAAKVVAAGGDAGPPTIVERALCGLEMFSN
jgi:hypothetical protein